jgi:hypothetical protein
MCGVIRISKGVLNDCFDWKTENVASNLVVVRVYELVFHRKRTHVFVGEGHLNEFVEP